MKTEQIEEFALDLIGLLEKNFQVSLDNNDVYRGFNESLLPCLLTMEAQTILSNGGLTSLLWTIEDEFVWYDIVSAYQAIGAIEVASILANCHDSIKPYLTYLNEFSDNEYFGFKEFLKEINLHEGILNATSKIHSYSRGYHELVLKYLNGIEDRQLVNLVPEINSSILHKLRSVCTAFESH